MMSEEKDELDIGCGCAMIPLFSALTCAAMYFICQFDPSLEQEDTPTQPEPQSSQQMEDNPQDTSTSINDNSTNVRAFHDDQGNTIYFVMPDAQSNNYSSVPHLIKEQYNKKQLTSHQAFKIDTRSKLNNFRFNLREEKYRA